MAQLALNKFQTVTLDITTSDQTPYTAPTGYTSIVLYAHVTNVSSTAATFTYVPLDGKLVLETSDSVKISASANSKLKLILSILETAN